MTQIETHYKQSANDGNKLIIIFKWLQSLDETFKLCRTYTDIFSQIKNQMDERFHIKNIIKTREKISDLLDFLTHHPAPAMYLVTPLYDVIQNKKQVYNICITVEELRLELYEYNKSFKAQILETIKRTKYLNAAQKTEYDGFVERFENDIMQLIKNEIIVNPFASGCLTIH